MDAGLTAEPGAPHEGIACSPGSQGSIGETDAKPDVFTVDDELRATASNGTSVGTEGGTAEGVLDQAGGPPSAVADMSERASGAATDGEAPENAMAASGGGPDARDVSELSAEVARLACAGGNAVEGGDGGAGPESPGMVADDGGSPRVPPVCRAFLVMIMQWWICKRWLIGFLPGRYGAESLRNDSLAYHTGVQTLELDRSSEPAALAASRSGSLPASSAQPGPEQGPTPSVNQAQVPLVHSFPLCPPKKPFPAQPLLQILQGWPCPLGRTLVIGAIFPWATNLRMLNILHPSRLRCWSSASTTDNAHMLSTVVYMDPPD